MLPAPITGEGTAACEAGGIEGVERAAKGSVSVEFRLATLS
jgi:hypothetical protein